MLDGNKTGCILSVKTPKGIGEERTPHAECAGMSVEVLLDCASVKIASIVTIWMSAEHKLLLTLHQRDCLEAPSILILGNPWTCMSILGLHHSSMRASASFLVTDIVERIFRNGKMSRIERATRTRGCLGPS
jgi:hypothetical protein